MPKLEKRRICLAMDSDGCVFDTMEVKHRRAFVPALIEVFNLDHISSLVEEIWCFVNLYSRDRGLNRFEGLYRSFEELRRHPVLKKFPSVMSAILPELSALKRWINSGNPMSNESLEAEVKYLRERFFNNAGAGAEATTRENIEELELCLTWSKQVNEYAKLWLSSADTFASAAPFIRNITQTSQDLSLKMVVISQSPLFLLNRQWNEAGLADKVSNIYGQEAGKKELILKQELAKSDLVLFLGDSPSDFEAARSAGVPFFPIIPKRETECWERLNNEAWQKVIEGSYQGIYESKLLDEFFHALPLLAPWESSSLKRVG